MPTEVWRILPTALLLLFTTCPVWLLSVALLGMLWITWSRDDSNQGELIDLVRDSDEEDLTRAFYEAGDEHFKKIWAAIGTATKMTELDTAVKS